MAAELQGQMVTGTPLNEHECFEWAIEGLRTSAESFHAMRTTDGDIVRLLTKAITGVRVANKCLEGARLLRGDHKWGRVVHELDRLEDNIFNLRSVPLANRLAVIERFEQVLLKTAHYVGKEKDRGGPAMPLAPRMI